MSSPKSPAKSPPKSPVKLPTRPAKVEPKTFFANERTFIQWIQPALILSSVSVAFQGAGQISEQRTIFYIGLSLNVLGLFGLAWALGVYLWRLRKIKAHDPTGHDLRLGPLVYVLLLVAFLVAVTVLLGVKVQAAQSPGPAVLSSCTKTVFNSSRSRALNFAPSGLVYHAGRQSYFVASPNRLFEVRAADFELLSSVAVPSADLEAVTLDPSTPDLLYLGERVAGKAGRLLAFDLGTMTVTAAADLSTLEGVGFSNLAALSFCPEAICGSGLNFLVGGASSKLWVVRFLGAPGSNKTALKVRPEAVDAIDLIARLCSLGVSCDKSLYSELREAHVSDDTVYLLSTSHSEQRLHALKLKMLGGPGAVEVSGVQEYQLQPLPYWEAFVVRERAVAPATVVLGHDVSGILTEHSLTAASLRGDC